MASNNTPGINPLADHNKWKLLADLKENTLASIQWFKSLHKRVLYYTHDDRLFARGENVYGQLGIGHRDDVDKPTLVEGLEGQTVVDIVGSEEITLVLTQHGRVYVWGANRSKQIENIPQDCITRPIHKESLKNIVSIACGQMHSMVLDKHGKMLIWGWNSNGQIGNNTGGTQSHPIQLDMFTTEVITQIQCGACSSMVLLKNGNVYAWGCLFGQNHHTPVKLNVCDHKVKHIACARNALVSLTQQGQIFIHRDNVTTPHLIQSQHIQFTSVFVIDCEKFAQFETENLVLANSATQQVYHTSGVGMGNIQWNESSLSPAGTIVKYSSIQVSPFRMTLTHSSKNDKHAVRVTRAVADLFNKQDKSDLVFKFPEGLKIYGHRVLLRILSPYMETMLSDTWARESEIEVSEYSYPLYRYYIEFLYTGFIPSFITLTDLIHLYDLANCHLEEKLKNKCMRLISRKLDLNNCCKLYEFSVKYSLEDLKGQIIGLATNNFFKIPPDSFAEISHENLVSFIQSIVTN